MQRTLICLLVVFLFFSQPLVVAAADQVLVLEQLIGQALEANPQIVVYRQRAAAAREQVPQAGAWEDPMLGLGLLNVPEGFDLAAEDMTSKEISLSQKVPFGGKRRLKREAAQQQAAAVEAQIGEIVNEVVKNVKLVYFELSHVRRAAEVTHRNKAILEDYSRLAQTRYSVGQGIQEDVIRVQVEISRMLDELLMLDQRRRSLEAQMNMLLNRPSREPLGAPVELPFKPYPLDIERLQEMALGTSPVLRALRSEVSAGESEFQLAGRDRYPDFNFRLAYGQREDRPDMFSAVVEMNLPVFSKSKQNRKVDETAAELSARQSRMAAAQNELFYTIADLTAMAQRLERQVDLYRTGIIPQVTLQLQSAVSAYTVNKADFMTLLDSHMRLYRSELDYHQAVNDYAKSIAGLEAAVGTSLEQSKEP